MSAMNTQPDNDSASNGKRLYAAYMYAHGYKPKIMHVSHNPRALRRRCPFAPIFPVRCVERIGNYATYERLSKEPVQV